jgi:hypothetical protein
MEEKQEENHSHSQREMNVSQAVRINGTNAEQAVPFFCVEKAGNGGFLTE